MGDVLVLLPQRAQLRNAEVLLVEAPAGELQPATGSGRVGVLHLDQSIPALGLPDACFAPCRQHSLLAEAAGAVPGPD